MRPLKRLYGRTRVADFGPRALKAVRQEMIESGWSRGVVNQAVNLVRAIFRWGVHEELVPGHVHGALTAVTAIRRGRSNARETEPVKPVPEASIAKVRPYVSRQVWALIQLQLLTGARVGELVRLRPIDLDTSGDVWTATISDHKTAHHGSDRTIYFGPRLSRSSGFSCPDGRLTLPCSALAKPSGSVRSRPRPIDGPASGRHPVRPTAASAITTRPTAFGGAVHRACEAAGIDQWSPHRLRHNAASRLRRDFGIDLAQTILGHRLGSAIKEIYAEANVAKAIEVIGKVG